MREVSDKETFSQSDYSLVYPEGMELHFWNSTRNKIIYSLLKPFVEQNDLVMDVGCGTGIFVNYLRRNNLNVRGVEKGAPKITPLLCSVIDTETDLFDLPENVKKKIKLVTLLDVIEHIQEPSQFLKKIYSEIPNCERIIITVPARMEIWSNYDDDWGHFVRYDRPSLNRELLDAGFTPVTTRYCFHWLYVVMLLMKWMGLKRKTSLRSPSRNKFVAGLHWFLGGITNLESRIVPGAVPGSSIVCLANRNQGKDSGFV